MNRLSQRLVRSVPSLTTLGFLLSVQWASPALVPAASLATSTPRTIKVRLTEWKVELTPASVPAGSAIFEVTNSGTIPHAFEVEGRGLEQKRRWNGVWAGGCSTGLPVGAARGSEQAREADAAHDHVVA